MTPEQAYAIANPWMQAHSIDHRPFRQIHKRGREYLTVILAVDR